MEKRLEPVALGLSLGTLWGICVVLMSWLNAMTGDAYTGWFGAVVRAIDSCYPGYAPSFLGGIWGGILGFIDGLICGVLVAALYNFFARPAEAPPPTPAPESEDL